jgi:hypothetical protein
MQPILLPEQAMKARNSYVIQSVSITSHDIGGHPGFFGDGDIGGPGGNDQD